MPSFRARVVPLLALFGLFGLFAAAPTLVGCGSTAVEDPATALVRLRSPELMVTRRVAAADEAVDAVAAGVLPEAEVWDSLKTLAWSANTPQPLRRRSVELLVSKGVERDPESVRTFVRLRLPTERDRFVVAGLATAAADAGWTETTTALVRRLAVDDVQGDPNRRIEAAALLALHPDRSLEATVFSVFLDPETPAADDAARWRASVRGEVWDLLGRLDRDASVRAQLLSPDTRTRIPADARGTVAALGRGVRELDIVPDSAGELAWLERLAGDSAVNRAWWREAAAAVDRVPPAKRLGVSLRHLEPIRWASLHRPSLFNATRADLLADLETRLASRELEFRTVQMGTGSRARSRERLEDWADTLRWADLLAMLVLDEALADPALQVELFRFVQLDRGDEGTEYGGTVEAIDTVPAGSPGLIGREEQRDGFRAVLYPPRSRDRGNDNVFIASLDMIRQSDRALAHFHQQVQRPNNDRFAGPSSGDLAYARRSGRTCVVFTSVGDDAVNVDVYQPNGAVVDLGTIERPRVIGDRRGW